MPVSSNWLRTLSAKLGRMIPAVVADAPIKNWRHEIEIACLLFSGFSNMLGAQLRWNLPNPLGGSARYRISYSNYDFSGLCPCLLCGRSRSCCWSVRYCFNSRPQFNTQARFKFVMCDGFYPASARQTVNSSQFTTAAAIVTFFKKRRYRFWCKLDF